MEIYFIFGGILLILIFRNLEVHFYYKAKHRKFIESLKGKNYTLIKDVITDIDHKSSKSMYNYQLNKAVVILFEGHIFLLITSKIFKQAQPILQISKIGNSEKFSNIWEEINYISKNKVGNKLRITGFSMRGSAKIDYKIFLDFTKSDFDLEQYLNEIM